jgi:hypothetical protein
MDRRYFIALAGAVSVAGCSTNLLGDSALDIGESTEFDGEIEVTVTDNRTASELTLSTGGGGFTEPDSFEAPSSGRYALFKLTVDNITITEQDAPQFNIANYNTLKNDDETLYTRGINDIRVFGGSEGGFLPDGHDDMIGYDSITAGSSNLTPYPQSVAGTRPKIGADESITGWVYGLIQSDATPKLRITFRGTTKNWAVNESE